MSELKMKYFVLKLSDSILVKELKTQINDLAGDNLVISGRTLAEIILVSRAKYNAV